MKMKNQHQLKKSMLVMIMFMIVSSVFAQAQWQYISPVPGSKFINPEQAIALRHGEILDLATVKADLFSITASRSGEISGNVKLSLDGRTLIFEPEKPFGLNENVSVHVAAGIKTSSGLELPELSFSFQVKPFDNSEMLNEYYLMEENKELRDYDKNSDAGNRSKKPAFKNDNILPERFPPAHVTEFDNPTAGNIFCTPRPMGAAPYDPYSTILDNYGTPVYYREWPRRNNDFKLLVNNQLTFCDFDGGNTEINKYLLMDSHFNIIDTLVMGNGYHVDQHDILMRENGNHFLMAYDPQIVGMDTVVPGGDPEATVIGFIVQELDADHNVIFQWRSWDHYEITDANHTDFLDDRIDYVHGNAFEIDLDGNLLMSQRNMEEITKIDMNTGEIIWRFGLHAKNNMFTFLNDTVGFSWQHDVRRLPNGNVTVYDNGNYHPTQFSQALEYHLDVENLTAELVWDYQHDPIIYGRATGAHRRLENNNAFICWGLTWPMNYSEVTHEKNLAWDFGWTEDVWDYRAFKFDWNTDLFELSQDTVDFGVYDDYVAWPKIITITNNSSEQIEITSTHNYLECYDVVTPLPLVIEAGGSVNFQFNLNPSNEEGQLDDVLTLNYDSYYSDSLHQRIARQIFVTAYIEDLNAPEASVTPENGAVDVARNTQIDISFNESVVYPDGSVIKSADLTDLLIFKENDANGADVEFMAYLDAWKRNIAIIPMEELTPGMQYYVELPGGTLADHEGHVMNDAVMTTFTTIDDVPPTVEINPADSTTGVYINPMITITFDEPVQTFVGSEITSEDIAAFFNLKYDDETGEDVPFLGVINDDKNLITIHPVENLDSYQYYYIEMMADAVMDMAGNPIEETHFSHFETGEEVGIPESTHPGFVAQPNPFSDAINLNFDSEGMKTIIILDINGKTMAETSTKSNRTSLNFSDQPAGIYIIKVQFENGQTGTSKIIKK
jgi:hypothetical protein